MVNNWYKLSDKRLRKIVFEKYNGKCAYCGGDLSPRFCVDHIIPLQRHKTILNDDRSVHKIENFNPACPPCNISKNSFTLEVWRSELELKQQRLERDSSTYRLLKKFGLVGVIKTKVNFYFETLNNG